MHLQFDDNRGREVFGILQRLWEAEEGVFAGVVLPQNRVTLPADPVQRANWLMFAAITQRGGIISEDPFRYLQALAQQYPTLMDPKGVLENWQGPRHVQEALQEIVISRAYKQPLAAGVQSRLWDEPESEQADDEAPANTGLYKVDEFATSWWRNATTVVQRWDNNILNAFADVDDFEGFFARANYKRNELGIHGMRRKILSLLTIWLQEFGLVPFFPTPIPVDFHAMRLLFGTGVVTACDIAPFAVKTGKHPEHFAGRRMVRVTERIMDEITLWSQPFMVRHGFNHRFINSALWVLSRELCPYELQNQSTGRKLHMRINWSDKLQANPQQWPVPYRDPARQCPLASQCRLTSAWGPYYDWGLLTLDRRVQSPHQLLPDWVPPPRNPRWLRNART